MRSLSIYLPLLFLSACVTAQESPPAAVPYIDAHSHLLPGMTPPQEAAFFRKAGLAGFVIMHPDLTPVQEMRQGNEGYVVPSFSLARLPDMPGLRLSEGSASAMAVAADAGTVCGFGEIPTRIMPRTEPSDDLSLLNPNRLAIYRAANARGLPVNLHVDIVTPAVEASIARIASDYPKTKIVLAHAGWSASPALIERLMAEHSNIYADLSVRLDPAGGLPSEPLPPGSQPPGAMQSISIIQPDGSLKAEWHTLIARFPDRFLFALDMSEYQRPKHIDLLMATARKALSPLGSATENAVAHGNIERLFRGCRTGFGR